MGTLWRGLVCVVLLSEPLSASGPKALQEIETLAGARLLAGPRVADLPIVLSGDRPEWASPNAEAWIVRDGAGSAHQIVLYTQSETFRCANTPRAVLQCRLKLASIITHEAWHFHHGPNEAMAYTAQLAFLTFHGASPEMLSGVALARNRVLAAEQFARSEALRRYRER